MGSSIMSDWLEQIRRQEARHQMETAQRGADLVRKTTMTLDRVMLSEREAASNLDDESWNAWARQVARREFVKMEADLIRDLDAYHAELTAQIAEMNRKLAEFRAELAAATENKAAPSSIIALRGRV
jgi:hypothetical protein